MSDYSIPDDSLYTQEDEWVRIENDQVLVGITDYAQQQLGDICFVEVPSKGSRVEQGEPFGVIESVKAVSELFCPISGTVTKMNDELVDHPELVNAECYGDGWLVAIEPSDLDEMEQLMDAAEYQKYVAEREE